MKYSPIVCLRVFSIMLLILQFSACSKPHESGNQPAKPTEVKNQTYRMIGGRSVVAIISSDELEIRQGGENLVCKYTEQDNKLRVIVNALGTTTAKYFDITQEGLVDEGGDIYYEPETFQKILAQIQLNTELVEAVERNDAAGIDALIAKGASVEARNNTGTVLMIAVNGGLTNAVSALLKNGANPNQKAEGDGKTPLMLAAGWQSGWGGVPRKPEHDKIVSILCENMADLNLPDKGGNTALMLSLMNNNLEATKILVAAGADPSIKNSEDRDAFALATSTAAKLLLYEPWQKIKQNQDN